jgi:ferric-dicitrate binding protein FerR (iron transport regulator)
MMRSAVFAFGAFLSALSFAAGAEAQTRIGVAGAVRNEVTATQATQVRPLAVGGSVFQDETIRTGASSVAQLVFVDQTTLSIGPRSEVRLDRFVYDPQQSVGDVAISLANGALRFISGAQNPRSYSVRTPVATIGVRGTVVDFLFIDGRMFGILVEGGADFTLPDGSSVSLDRPGTALEFLADGEASNPMTWRGRYEAGVQVASFPLYGNPFADTPWREGADNLEDETTVTEELQTRPPSGDENPPPAGPG